jgi:hypothetical protein
MDGAEQIVSEAMLFAHRPFELDASLNFCLKAITLLRSSKNFVH